MEQCAVQIGDNEWFRQVHPLFVDHMLLYNKNVKDPCPPREEHGSFHKLISGDTETW